MSGDIAEGLVGQYVNLTTYLPLKAERVAALDAYLQANAVEKTNIWPAREVTLDSPAALTPIVIAIWDSGIDTAVYADNLWTNPAEVADGTDTDGNGWIDDLHGIAFDLHANRDPAVLFPLHETQLAAYPQMRDFTKGILYLQANIDSPEASAMRAHVGTGGNIISIEKRYWLRWAQSMPARRLAGVEMSGTFFPFGLMR